MEVCSEYSEHKWGRKPGICIHCNHTKDEHQDIQLRNPTPKPKPDSQSTTSSIVPPPVLTEKVPQYSKPSPSIGIKNSTAKSGSPHVTVKPRSSDDTVLNVPVKFRDSVKNSPRASSMIIDPKPQSVAMDSTEKKLPPCRYGMNCYRKNRGHFQAYSHPPGFPTGLHGDEQTIPQNSDLKDSSDSNSKDSEKHIRLAEERFRAFMGDYENKAKAYEDQIQKLQGELAEMAKYHQGLESALAEELEKRERRELEHQKILAIKRDTPSYWDSNTFQESYREIQLLSNSAEFNIISQLLNDTIETHDNNFGTIYGEDPTEFIVTKIIRIQNERLWREYCFKKVSIEIFEFLKNGWRMKIRYLPQ